MTSPHFSASAAAARESFRLSDGKFGTQPATEADLELSENTASDYIDGYTEGFTDGLSSRAATDADAAFRMRQAENERRRAARAAAESRQVVFRQTDGTVIDPETALRYAQEAARKYYYEYDLRKKTGNQLASPDDLAAEGLAAVARHLRRWEEGKTEGIDSMKSMISSCVANHATRATAVVWRPADRAGYRVYAAQVAQLEQELDRPLRQTEKDALAEKIRETWRDQRHKPSKDFRMAWTVNASLDRSATSDPDGPTLGEVLAVDGEVVPTVMPNTYVDTVMTLQENKKRTDTAKANRMGYNALAEWSNLEYGTNLPLAKKAVHSQKTVARLKATVLAGGGVMESLQRWSDGRPDEATEAAFEVFDVEDERQYEEVVAFFTRLESKGTGRAQKLWELSLAYSSTKHKD